MPWISVKPCLLIWIFTDYQKFIPALFQELSELCLANTKKTPNQTNQLNKQTKKPNPKQNKATKLQDKRKKGPEKPFGNLKWVSTWAPSSSETSQLWDWQMLYYSDSSGLSRLEFENCCICWLPGNWTAKYLNTYAKVLPCFLLLFRGRFRDGTQMKIWIKLNLNSHKMCLALPKDVIIQT